ncbi:MAG: hypothetical protein IJG17_00340 [Eubacterium sp.]|nr:hypothetical protein [Eubacterium sp.]MBQ6364377.1 hypothetical protein [Lachnospiraceae bacterium]
MIDLFGCEDLDDFKKLTGFTFRGFVHPDDFASVSVSISEQIRTTDEHIDNAVYRIIRKDGDPRDGGRVRRCVFPDGADPGNERKRLR